MAPGSADIHNELGFLLARQGRLEEAATHLKKSLQIEPDRVEAINNLAWIFATHKDERVREPEEAVRLAGRACQLTQYKSPHMLDTLAVAYAAAGRFSEAAGTAEKAMELARTSGQKQLADVIRGHLLLFEAGKPYRDKGHS